MENKPVDLLQLMSVIKTGVEEALPGPLWVTAEIASVSLRRNGHCYMELSQSCDGVLKAQARAIIWSSVYRQVAGCFESFTGASLAAGQQVLLCVTANFSPQYGLSLIIQDIDPAYTLGDAERKRRETVERLEKEGLMCRQRDLDLPDLPYSLAVISSAEAAGYRDFLRQLHENDYGFRFSTTLFPAIMQGAGCAASIADALGRIEDECAECLCRPFDAVLILRGGGGKLDLSCFDDYDLCAAIARHPFPVLTAVGHDQDVHICDMVAYDSVKTPTALADYFVDMYVDEDARLYSLRCRLDNALKTKLAQMLGYLDVLRARLDAADPRRLLEKGYVLALDSDGRPIGSVAGRAEGDDITVVLKDGVLRCKVEKVE